jgi:hypothetical protein
MSSKPVTTVEEGTPYSSSSERRDVNEENEKMHSSNT